MRNLNELNFEFNDNTSIKLYNVNKRKSGKGRRFMMGIYIFLDIARSVTREEWKKVYEETLELVAKFPLAEVKKVKCKETEVYCLTRTKERKETYGWDREKTRIGWETCGDYDTLRRAEDYYVPRDLIGEDKIKKNVADAMMGAVYARLMNELDDSLSNQVYSIWGGKTQGEPYHMYLLAIACLIEYRLKEKAFVGGDITRGQCKKAVRMANQYLEKPIDIPDRCDMERLLRRVSKLPLNEQQQLEMFQEFYLGTQDATFGERMRKIYSKEQCDIYWKRRFANSFIGTNGFWSNLSEYLLWGFDLENLCVLVNYNDEEGNPQYEKFIQSIMETNIYI